MISVPSGDVAVDASVTVSDSEVALEFSPKEDFGNCFPLEPVDVNVAVSRDADAGQYFDVDNIQSHDRKQILNVGANEKDMEKNNINSVHSPGADANGCAGRTSDDNDSNFNDDISSGNSGHSESEAGLSNRTMDTSMGNNTASTTPPADHGDPRSEFANKTLPSLLGDAANNSGRTRKQ
jgi:hypothetical protein